MPFINDPRLILLHAIPTFERFLTETCIYILISSETYISELLPHTADKLSTVHKDMCQNSHAVSSHRILPLTIAAMLGWLLKDPSIFYYDLND